jgi:hypothetical protein
MSRLKLTKATRDAMWRAFLRTIPLVPGPELYDVLKSVRQSQNDFDQQVSEAVEGLQKTSGLVVALQNGITDRMKQLEQLRQEHDKYSELAQIEGKKAEALMRQIETTLGKEQRKERWIALAMHLGVGLLYFLLGVAVSVPFKSWMDKIWSLLFH